MVNSSALPIQMNLKNYTMIAITIKIKHQAITTTMTAGTGKVKTTSKKCKCCSTMMTIFKATKE